MDITSGDMQAGRGTSTKEQVIHMESNYIISEWIISAVLVSEFKTV